MSRKRSRTRKTKSLGLLSHAQRRASLRYDLEISWDTLVLLGRLIARHRKGRVAEDKKSAALVRQQSRNISLWYVCFEGQWLPVVYDAKRELIVTVLPDGAWPETPPPSVPIIDDG